MNQPNEKLIEKINKVMGLGKRKSKQDMSRYPFYLVLFLLLILIFIMTIIGKN